MLANGGQLDGRRILGRKTLELMTATTCPGGPRWQSSPSAASAKPASTVSDSGSDSPSAWGRRPPPWRARAGEYYWGGAASTAFWIDPVEDLFVVFMTQLFPSIAYPFRAQLRALVYQALDD